MQPATENGSHVTGSPADMLRALMAEKTMDVVDILFHIDQGQFGAEVCRRARDHFEGLVTRLLVSRAGTRQGRISAAALDRLLFRREQYRYEREPRREVITLTATLERKKGACLGLTALYYALADRLSVPIRPIIYEGHIAACWTATNPPQHIEVSRRGMRVPHRTAQRLYRASPGYPIVLAKMQFIAVYLSNYAAFALMPQGRLLEAIGLLDLAVELFPAYTGAWINRSSLLLLLDDRRRARESIGHAAGLRPGSRFYEAAHTLSNLLK